MGLVLLSNRCPITAVKSPVKEAASNPLKRGVDQLEDTPSSPTSVPAIKMAKTASLHPSIAGEKVGSSHDYL